MEFSFKHGVRQKEVKGAGGKSCKHS